MELRRRGFSVATMDWRGQGASVRELADRRKAHIDRFAQYDDDLDVFMEQVVRADGGNAQAHRARPFDGRAYSAARACTPSQNEFTTAVLTAPMIERADARLSGMGWRAP